MQKTNPCNFLSHKRIQGNDKMSQWNGAAETSFRKSSTTLTFKTRIHGSNKNYSINTYLWYQIILLHCFANKNWKNRKCEKQRYLKLFMITMAVIKCLPWKVHSGNLLKTISSIFTFGKCCYDIINYTHIRFINTQKIMLKN